MSDHPWEGLHLSESYRIWYSCAMPTWLLYTLGIVALIVLIIVFIKQRQSQ